MPSTPPYQYAGNKPITKTDRDGLEETGSSPQQNNGVKPAGGEDKTYTTPGGQNITIPWSQYTGGKNIERVAPSNEVRELKKGGEVFVPEGSLTEFMINGTTLPIHLFCRWGQKKHSLVTEIRMATSIIRKMDLKMRLI
jgi:hypothetical protein